ncbi:MAG: hypothetical protein JO301_10190 [Chitinophagaceae bacterium]|nr:hypothetical protein [Chitinophagaceae bacterium]
MAEQEVIKHTKKVYKIWNSDEHGFWHKFREFAIEIFIIVFAVTISIWLHSWNEHRHEQADVKEFLLGLREDLKKDTGEMKDDIGSYRKQAHIFQYITSGANISLDTLKHYGNYILNSTYLVPNNGRFEGFKSSGKIGNIENYELQNNILDLYQENIPALLNSTSAYIEYKKQLWQYLRIHVKQLSSSAGNLPAVLAQDEGQNISGVLANPSQTIERYDTCISKMSRIIRQIDSTYGARQK